MNLQKFKFLTSAENTQEIRVRFTDYLVSIYPPTIHNFNVDNQTGGWMDFYAYLVWTKLWRSNREELALGLWAQLILQRCTSGPETGSYREISMNNRWIYNYDKDEGGGVIVVTINSTGIYTDHLVDLKFM